MRQKVLDFLAAAHRDDVMLTGIVAVGAGTGTLGRRTRFVERRMSWGWMT